MLPDITKHPVTELETGDAGGGPPSESGAVAAAAPDPFDPASLRLSQNFAASTGVKKLLTTVPVRKPDKSWFVRVHPDPSYSLETAVVDLKEDQETYLVERSLWDELASESTFCPCFFHQHESPGGTVLVASKAARP